MTQPTGRRAQTKALIRRNIVDAAMGLFEQHGFDAVTVQQIADEAGVTRRTVHRYFPSKAAVIQGHDDDLAAQVLTALQRRPAAESVLTASRAAIWELLYGDSELAMTARQLDTLRRVRLLGIDNPALRQATWFGSQRRIQAVAEEFAHRCGHPVTDLHLQLTATTWTSGVMLALDRWAAGPDVGLAALAATLDTVLTTLSNGLDIPATTPPGCDPAQNHPALSD